MRFPLLLFVAFLAVACRASHPASEGHGRDSTPVRSDGLSQGATSDTTPPANLEEWLAARMPTLGASCTYDQDTAALLRSLRVRQVGPAASPVWLIEPSESSGGDGRAFEILPLRHAQAKPLRNVLHDLVVSASVGAGPLPVRLAVDERTNSILVHGSESTVESVRALVARLDVEAADAR